ncbi:MAG: 50S ribosomal protein L11 methyltransferase [Pseudomonadales bacterium]|nr:50S ribosomal protein L11 methyltransferase [Pseudomonadales bacterium]
MQDLFTPHSILTQCVIRSMPGETIVSTRLPLCPEIRLYLVASNKPESESIQSNIASLMDAPPYWALCWAGGQVLARYVLDNPKQLKGKTVLDMGAGSGVAAIAAAMAGAKKVYACDCDTDAILAIQENAGLNHVEIEAVQTMDQISEKIDLIIAADLLYDGSNIPLLEQFLKSSDQVLIADSRMDDLGFPDQKLLLKQRASTCPDLDNTGEYSQVSVWGLNGSVTEVGSNTG